MRNSIHVPRETGGSGLLFIPPQLFRPANGLPIAILFEQGFESTANAMLCMFVDGGLAKRSKLVVLL
jgi:hypothetical protein